MDSQLIFKRYFPSTPGRARAEKAVFSTYQAYHGAELKDFSPVLFTLETIEGKILATGGVRYPRPSDMFVVEQYLDENIAQAISRKFGKPICRDCVVEIGCLSSQSPSAGKKLIVRLIETLYFEGYHFGAMAVTQPLALMLDKMGIELAYLGTAKEENYKSSTSKWGDYYDTNPVILAGDIPKNYTYLTAHFPTDVTHGESLK